MLQSNRVSASASPRVCTSLFSQILRLISAADFRAAVAATNAERHQRGFSSWDQTVALLFCQLGRAHSLREICQGLASCEGKLNHLGVEDAPKRSTLAYANAHRPWQMFQLLFEKTYARLGADLKHSGCIQRKFRFRNKLYSIDSTTIDLCLEVFDWAHFLRAKGAVKIHLQLDHDGYLPCFALLTDGRGNDMTTARHLEFAPGSLVVFDKGYCDYGWFGRLCAGKVFFVTRIRDNALYEVLEERPLPGPHSPGGQHIRRDQIIRLSSESGQKCPHNLRLVTMQDPDSGQVFEFLTNHLGLVAPTIAALYKDRWSIESFFKELKTHLKIKTFLGTTPNAVWAQIWTALLSLLLLKYLQLKARYGWSLSNLVALLRFNLFTYRDLWTWLDTPVGLPPDSPGAVQVPPDLPASGGVLQTKLSFH